VRRNAEQARAAADRAKAKNGKDTRNGKDKASGLPTEEDDPNAYDASDYRGDHGGRD
jgi:hypothetical protein